ncbi:hypothetical protein D7Y07_09270 [Bacteroides acidifaciens]|uniref:Sulfatase N-terminal domain-containing protein n=1 Tax=Bacteroides acidifaciens TaxID=85831 RepID=A0A3L8A8E5_9BACE|nr:hypothetical protein D7Y07_09270 [Bacteroides acidifaciens]
MTETHLLNEGNHIFEKNEEADNTIIIFMSDNGELVSESYRCGGECGINPHSPPHFPHIPHCFPHTLIILFLHYFIIYQHFTNSLFPLARTLIFIKS